MKLSYTPERNCAHRLTVIVDGVEFAKYESLTPIYEIDADGDEVSVYYEAIGSNGKPLGDRVLVRMVGAPKVETPKVPTPTPTPPKPETTYTRPPAPPKPDPSPIIIDRELVDAKFKWSQRAKDFAHFITRRKDDT
jgi:hypothetical protein